MASQGNGKFQNRNKLFIANFPTETFGEAQFRQMFAQFGEVGEVYVGKGFAFVTMDYRCNAEVAKMQLAKTAVSQTGPLDVRWAASNACVEVHYLNPSVSNELLFETFSQFGEVERAVVAVDAHKRASKGVGYVEFLSKGVAAKVVARLTKDHLVMPGAPWPVVVNINDPVDDDVGMPEARMKGAGSKDQNGNLHRDVFLKNNPAHITQQGTPENAFMSKWMELARTKTAKEEETAAWYDTQKQELLKEHNAALAVERVKATLAQQQQFAQQQQQQKQQQQQQQQEMHARAMAIKLLEQQQQQAQAQTGWAQAGQAMAMPTMMQQGQGMPMMQQGQGMPPMMQPIPKQEPINPHVLMQQIQQQKQQAAMGGGMPQMGGGVPQQNQQAAMGGGMPQMNKWAPMQPIPGNQASPMQMQQSPQVQMQQSPQGMQMQARPSMSGMRPIGLDMMSPMQQPMMNVGQTPMMSPAGPQVMMNNGQGIGGPMGGGRMPQMMPMRMGQPGQGGFM